MDSLSFGLDDPASYWRAVVESAGLGVWDYDRMTGEKRLSNKCREIHHLQPSDPIPRTDEDWLALVHPDDVGTFREHLGLINCGEATDVAFEYRESDHAGHWVWILRRIHAFRWDDSGRATRFVGVDTDVTSIKSAEMARTINAKQLEIVVSLAGLGIWKLDCRTGEVMWDERLREIYGVREKQGPISHGVWERYVHPDDLERVLTITQDRMMLRQDYSLDYRIVREDGEVRHIRSKASFLADGLTEPIMLGVDWDVTDDLMQAANLEQMNRLATDRLAELTLAQMKFERLSRHDPLTGLPNRRSLQEFLDQLQSDDHVDSEVAFIMLDIDQFKSVNDTHGHAFGDRLLQAVAGALDSEISPHGLLARTGGDEFLAVLENVDSADTPMAVATSAIIKAREVSRALGHEITVSVGIDTGCMRMKSKDELFARADRAMYRAKRAGGAIVMVS